MLATASVQDQGRTGASLAIVLWRVVDEDVSVGVNGLRIESKEVVQELGRSLTCCENTISECIPKAIWKAARMLPGCEARRGMALVESRGLLRWMNKLAEERLSGQEEITNCGRRKWKRCHGPTL